METGLCFKSITLKLSKNIKLIIKELFTITISNRKKIYKIVSSLNLRQNQFMGLAPGLNTGKFPFIELMFKRLWTADAKNTPFYSSALHFLIIKHHCQPFLSGIQHCRPFKLFQSFFKHFLEHINAPLSGLHWKPEKCRSEE